MSDLFNKIYDLKMIKSQTTPLGTTCDTNLLFEILDEAEELENENIKYKNVLKTIKEKGLHNSNLNFVAICDSYAVYKRRMTDKWDTEINWDNKEALDLLKLLTRNEFDLIKEMLK